MSHLRQLKLGRATLTALTGLLWALSFGAVRDFIWADLREGVIKLHGLSRAERNLVSIGFALLFIMVGALVFNNMWRTESPLIPMQFGVPGRGSLLPVPLIPVILFLLSVAWSFMLTGALRTRRSVKIGVLLVYVALAASWISINSPITGPARLLLGWGVLVAVPTFFVISRWTRPRPVLEFSILLLLVSTTFAFAQLQAVESWRQSGIPTVFVSINSTMLVLSMLSMPFLLFVGIDIAEFTYRASGWVSDIAAAWLHHRVLEGVLLGAFVWRLYTVGAEAVGSFDGSSFGAGLVAYAGALGVPVIVGLVWWAVRRYRASVPGEAFTAGHMGRVAKKAAPPLIAAYLGIVGLSLALSFLTQFLGLIFGATSGAYRALDLNDQLLSQLDLWLVIVDGLALAAAYLMLRRGRRTLALYLGILGAVHLWIQLTNPGGPLELLSWTGSGPVYFWWVAVFAVVGLTWFVRGRLTPVRVQRLLFLLVITALLGQTDLIENPFSPFFGFTGIGLIALGIVWDSLTAGTWANHDSAGLPRPSRILLYLGYVLFSVAVLNWVVAAHNLAQVDFFSGDAAVRGLDILGKPLIYAVFAITLTLPANEDRPAEPARSPVAQTNDGGA